MIDICINCQNRDFCKYADEADKFVTEISSALDTYSFVVVPNPVFSIDIRCRYYRPTIAAKQVVNFCSNDYNVLNHNK